MLVTKNSSKHNNPKYKNPPHKDQGRHITVNQVDGYSEPSQESSVSQDDPAEETGPQPSVIHDAVFPQDPVLRIENFSLWYGDNQALFDINMPVAKKDKSRN